MVETFQLSLRFEWPTIDSDVEGKILVAEVITKAQPIILADLKNRLVSESNEIFHIEKSNNVVLLNFTVGYDEKEEPDFPNNKRVELQDFLQQYFENSGMNIVISERTEANEVCN